MPRAQRSERITSSRVPAFLRENERAVVRTWEARVCQEAHEVARRIRRDPDPRLRGTFLVALSGYALPEDVSRSREAGFDRHVAKPPNLEELTRLLAQAPARQPVG